MRRPLFYLAAAPQEKHGCRGEQKNAAGQEPFFLFHWVSLSKSCKDFQLNSTLPYAVRQMNVFLISLFAVHLSGARRGLLCYNKTNISNLNGALEIYEFFALSGIDPFAVS